MTLEWKHATDDVDWEELSALYRAAPLGEKPPLHLQKVFSNSMFKCFVHEDTKLVAAGRALADGGDCSRPARNRIAQQWEHPSLEVPRCAQPTR
ncbi:hypothetical protein [Hydrogenophaga sp. BPS33]|uniref:hypothetical protein n=1 Tax=Hydrogenophaga sp. BPS33 TaxID=2651974 RepID=UPI0013201FB1|nr:hypothetical protein [Hydrogenophaga sp. BPS33]QHE85721.1 hypothetical protein F9K07_12815 [Hydrogenophaga sp. BPS33]